MKRRQAVVAVALFASGAVHLLPAIGVLGAERLATLYGVAIADEALLLLMRHRALLFGVLGAFMLHAALTRPLQPWALLAGFASTASFVLLALSSPSLTPALRTVLRIDIALAALLLVALVLRGTDSR